jgi:hypothetical protein
MDCRSASLPVHRIQSYVVLGSLLFVLQTSEPRSQTPDDPQSLVAELQVQEYSTEQGNLEAVASGIAPPIEARVALSGYSRLLFFWEVNAPSLPNNCRQPAEIELELKDVDNSAWTKVGWEFGQSLFQYCVFKSPADASCDGSASTTVTHFPARIKIIVRPTCGPEFYGMPH